MRKLLFSCVAVAALSLGLGCQNKSSEMEGDMKASSSSMGADQCSMCAGTQHAKADGTCPSCGMMLTRSNAK